MGNIIQNTHLQIDQEAKVYLSLDQTKYQLDQNIKGKVLFKVSAQAQGVWSLNLKIFGIENAYYNFKQGNSSVYEYKIDKQQFFHKSINLFKNEIIQEEENYQYIEFDWNPQVLIPSLDYQFGPDFKCYREYTMEAELICILPKNKKIIEYDNQRILFYIQHERQDNNQMERFDQKKNHKIEAITTYKSFRLQKGLVFVSFEADKCIYFKDDYLNVFADVDNTFGYLNIKTAKILFYLEFLIKAKFIQGMPKILLGEGLLEENDHRKYSGKLNVQLSGNLNLPYQSASQRISCRYIIVLQLIFEQQCLGTGVDNVEIILPYMEYYRDDIDNIAPIQENKQELYAIGKGKKFMDPVYEKLDEKPTSLNKEQDFIKNRETRVAQLTQILTPQTDIILQKY